MEDATSVPFEGREARYADLNAGLHPQLKRKWESLGLGRLYEHQHAAIEAALRGEDVMVVTGTSSGKTLCFAGPVYQSLLSEPACRAMLIYPTKALAQDQMGKMGMLAPFDEFRIGCYDGDAPANQRSAIRRNAHIVLTNPDMLHVGILPGHENWVRYFKSLRWIVLDEAHTYRGVFGSHAALILRRLLRMCEAYGSRPQIIACSATVRNPEELFEQLTGRIPRVIDQDASPQGRKLFTFWAPTAEGDQAPSRNLLTARVLHALGTEGYRSLAFCRSRVGVELVLKYLREHAEKHGGAPGRQFESYRAGYLPAERRKIEQAIFKGELLGLVSTNAMELGVDIGGLDAVLMNGYPGTVSSFFQQAGRSGRSGQESAVVMVAGEDPLDQFVCGEAKAFLALQSEAVNLNPGNPNILAQQIVCAAHERPISATELMALHPKALDAAEELDRSGSLEFRAGRYYYPSYDAPAAKTNIRGSDAQAVRLFEGAQELGSMERWRALQYAHEGAVYLHRGASYVVRRLNLEAGEAHLEPFEGKEFTRPMVESVVEPLATLHCKALHRDELLLMGLRVTTQVVGFNRHALDGAQVLAFEPLDLPAQTFETIGVRFDLKTLDLLELDEVAMSGLHGAEHALLGVAPFFASCDRNDLGSAWYALMPDLMRPAIFVYDQTPGGVGLSEGLFNDAEKWTFGALRLVEGCSCEAGCPKCLLSSRCSMSNELLSKAEAIRRLREFQPTQVD